MRICLEAWHAASLQTSLGSQGSMTEDGFRDVVKYCSHNSARFCYAASRTLNCSARTAFAAASVPSITLLCCAHFGCTSEDPSALVQSVCQNIALETQRCLVVHVLEAQACVATSTLSTSVSLLADIVHLTIGSHHSAFVHWVPAQVSGRVSFRIVTALHEKPEHLPIWSQRSARQYISAAQYVFGRRLGV